MVTPESAKARNSCCRKLRVTWRGGQNDGGPGAGVTYRSWKHGGLSDGNWGHGGDAGAAGETFRNSERGDIPSLSLLPPPFISRRGGGKGAHCVTPARSQPSQQPGSTEGETGSCDDEWA